VGSTLGHATTRRRAAAEPRRGQCELSILCKCGLQISETSKTQTVVAISTSNASSGLASSFPDRIKLVHRSYIYVATLIFLSRDGFSSDESSLGDSECDGNTSGDDSTYESISGVLSDSLAIPARRLSTMVSCMAWIPTPPCSSVRLW